MHFLKSHLVAVSLLFASFGTATAQNKFIKDDTTVRTTMLETDSIFSNKTLVENIETISKYQNFKTALELTKLDKTVQGEGLYSVFVVTDKGFEKEYKDKELKKLFEPANSSKLTQLLSYHIIPGNVDKHSLSTEIKKRGGAVTYRTLAGKNLEFRQDGETIYIVGKDNSRSVITNFNLLYNNGIFHTIDKIIITP
jgi:uncharacterized surface protein with fasciclin (FAS1) repeats